MSATKRKWFVSKVEQRCQRPEPLVAQAFLLCQTIISYPV